MVAIGDSALYNQGNSDYGFNTAVGSKALFSNNTGDFNTATGYNALFYNTYGSYNTANGDAALFLNTTGVHNTATGVGALLHNITGQDNTATGLYALYSNTTGYDNIAIGSNALYYNTAGHSNTAIGEGALFNNYSGNYNSAVGYGAYVYQQNLSNASAFGSNATADASDKVSIGNTSVSSIGGQVGWTNFSVGRVKQNIKENVPGLTFINLLKPVTYNFSLAKEYELMGRKDSAEWKTKYDIEKINFTGFVAQDVDAAAKKIKYDFSGVDNTGKIMGLRYAEFVVPLVKAVQELSKENDEQKKINTDLQKQIDVLKAVITSYSQATVSTNKTQPIKLHDIAGLEQNLPNPFSNSTIINYTLPQRYSNAKLIITDKTGKTVKEINIGGSGKGSIQFDAASLSNGTYQYCLYVDRKLTGSKQMLLNK